MMFRLSFGWNEEANALDQAIDDALRDGYRTQDIFFGQGRVVTTSQMADRVIEALKAAA